MSSSHPNNPNGVPKPHTKPNPLRPLRKRPLVATSRRPMPKPSNGSQSSKDGPSKLPNGKKMSIEEARNRYGGWSEPPPPGYQDIPIVTTKRAMLTGMRYHLMKFNQPKVDDDPVDPTDQDEFARPVTLHRRDARQPPPGRVVKEEEEIVRLPPDEEELERQAQIKAEKDAQRAIDQAKIAPVVKEAAVPKKPKKQKEEKTSFNRAPKTVEAKKESDLRYEEALPWHLEDADGKNVWVGNYVSALSETNVVLMIDGSVFRMIPLEKWYRFTSKPPFQPLSIDQAEAFLNKKMDPGVWATRSDEKKADQKDMDETRRMLYGRGQMIKTESATFKAASRSEKLEHDELDMDDDEFQDDDEAPLFERNDDDDQKESKDRIRREQLGANLFGAADEGEIDKDLEQQLKEELVRKKLGKTTRKALVKRDREEIYESDNSADNPWSSSSESSDDEDDEKDKEKDDEKKDPESKESGVASEAKDKDKDKDKDKGKNSMIKSSLPHGKQKPSEISKKGKSLKRAGSPALSESSGNESSRKKIKKTATPVTGSRSGSPLPQAASRKTKGGAGSGSDGEATAGEMSDSAISRRKVKLVGSSKGTPSGSRAGSPVPGPTGGASPPSLSSSNMGWIEPAEILERIPPDGISITDLIKQFNGRLGDRPGQMPKSQWISLVKQLCDYGSDKRLRRK